MKSFIILFTISGLLLYACGNPPQQTQQLPAEDKVSAEQGTSTVTDTLSSNPDYAKGLELVGQSDCFTCHKIEDISVGPPYRDVAGKYENTKANRIMLAEKIIKGGQGNWGQIPMTPHPNLSKEDAQQIVKYIMLLKKK